MMKRPCAVFAVIGFLFFPLVFTQELAAVNSVCTVCSTTAYSYTYSKSKLHTTDTYDLYVSTTLDITRGRDTVTRLDLTRTKTAHSLENIGTPFFPRRYFTQSSTKTIRKNSTLTTTVCSPTATPADYPTPTYCACKSTVTITSGILQTIATTRTNYIYAATQTVQPTIYGSVSTLIVTDTVESLLAIAAYKWTKTIYRATETVTQNYQPTGVGSGNFTLWLMNNSEFELEHVTFGFCADGEGECWARPGPSEYSDAAVFKLVDGRLYDAINNRTCGFTVFYTGEYELYCGTESLLDAPSGHLAIDCLGNLRGYVGNSNTWGTNPWTETIQIHPEPDPVHGEDDAGENTDHVWVRPTEYFLLQARPYSG